MKNEEFMNIVDASNIRGKNLLIKKAVEYGNTDDRLSQFYRVSYIQEETPTQALTGMMMKHVTSVLDMAKDPLAPSLKMWRSKIDDLRNYAVLLEALVIDLNNINKPQED